MKICPLCNSECDIHKDIEALLPIEIRKALYLDVEQYATANAKDKKSFDQIKKAGIEVAKKNFTKFIEIISLLEELGRDMSKSEFNNLQPDAEYFRLRTKARKLLRKP